MSDPSNEFLTSVFRIVPEENRDEPWDVDGKKSMH